MATTHSSRRQRGDLLVAGACGAFVAVMVGAAYAAVPFYSWFCRTTGFGGTTQVASVVPSAALERKIKVRFDANVASGLPWRFEPEQGSIEARIGEVVTVNYRVVNEAARETVGVASYNVSPPTVGVYFSKINCFCFTDQRLAAGEKRDMAVVFFIDPALANDPEQKSLDAITLSYTMYLVRQPGPPQAESKMQAGPGRS